jgi:hypothetical protein
MVLLVVVRIVLNWAALTVLGTEKDVDIYRSFLDKC